MDEAPDIAAASAEETPIRILLLEDSDIDAELLLSHMRKANLAFEVTRAVDRRSFVRALTDEPDIILADYALPDFDGLSALTIARESRPTTPFIFVSGVVGEEFATNALKRGATDYVLKRNLVRLPAAVQRALGETRERVERHRAEAALQETQAAARIALEAADLGTWEYDPRSGALKWDARTRAMFGVEPDRRLAFADFVDGVHPADRDRMTRAVQAAIDPQGSGEIAADFRVVTAGGLERWVRTNGSAFFEDEVCVRLIGVLRDITEEKRADLALRRLNETLEARVAELARERDRTWAVSQELFAVLWPDGEYISVNPAWERNLGWRENEVIGRNAAQFIHPEDQDTLLAELQKLAAGQTVHSAEVRLRRRDGDWCWFSWSAVTDEGRIFAIGRDVTLQKEAGEALATSNAALRDEIAERERVEATLRQLQRLEAVGQLTSGVAHDFNNLLTVILGNIGFIEKDAQAAGLDGKLTRRLHNMRLAAERGATLTGQLLAFSRRQRLEPKSVNLNDTVANMRGLLESTIGGSVRLETVLKPGLWAALVDPTQIELIILNLAINARDALEVGGALTVETSNVVLRNPPSRPEEPPPGEYVMLAVADTGAGMSDEVLAKAFEPFFTTKAVGKGSGLGLAQVFGFAKQSGGGVRIDTKLGEGTTVKVFLPRAAAEGAAAPAERPAASKPEGSTLCCTVLLVDDDSGVREITGHMLESMGRNVISVGSGQAALDVLEHGEHVDLLAVDYAMPGMNGAETAEAAKALRSDLPVLFITGYADLAALQKVGESRIVQKPFRDEELREKVQKILGGKPQAGDTVIPLRHKTPPR